MTDGIKLRLQFKITFQSMAVVWQKQYISGTQEKELMLCEIYCGRCLLFSIVNNSFIFNLFLLLGIDVKKGRGRYIDTCMVTFAPRYLLDNKSTYKLAFVQREFARGRVRCFLFFTCYYNTCS